MREKKYYFTYIRLGNRKKKEKKKGKMKTFIYRLTKTGKYITGVYSFQCTKALGNDIRGQIKTIS